MESRWASITIFGFVTGALTALSSGAALFLVSKREAARAGSVLGMTGGVLTVATRFARLAAFATLGLMAWFRSGACGSNGGLVKCAFILLAFGTPAYLATRVSLRRPEVD